MAPGPDISLRPATKTRYRRNATTLGMSHCLTSRGSGWPNARTRALIGAGCRTNSREPFRLRAAAMTWLAGRSIRRFEWLHDICTCNLHMRSVYNWWLSELLHTMTATCTAHHNETCTTTEAPANPASTQLSTLHGVRDWGIETRLKRLHTSAVTNFPPAQRLPGLQHLVSLSKERLKIALLERPDQYAHVR